MKVITNNVPRLLLDYNQLSDIERAEQDDNGHDEGCDYVRYRGSVYCLSDFMVSSRDGVMSNWDGYYSESAFSGVLVKFVDGDPDYVIMGLALS